MPEANSSLHSGRQFRSVQRISSAMAESSATTHPPPTPPAEADADEDEPEDIEEAAGEALERGQPPRPLSPPLHDLAFLRRTCDLGKMPVSALHTFLPRYQSASESRESVHESR